MTDTTAQYAGELLVVLPDWLEPAFRLAGTRTAVVPDDGADGQVQQIVRDAIATGAPGVVAVHPDLWDRAAAPIRRAWEQQLVPLIVALPSDAEHVAAGRRDAVLDLLARSVGYEITFTTRGES